MRRRPMLPDVRRDVALRPTPVRTFEGRVEALPAGIVGASGNPSEFDLLVGPRMIVHNVTAYLTPGQTLPDGGGDWTFNRYAGPPADRTGFDLFAQALADDGETGSIAIEVTGFAYVYVKRWFATHQQIGTLQVVITRDGDEITHDVPMGAAPGTRLFAEPLGKFRVRSGDTLAIREPNTSGAGQDLSSDDAEQSLVDVAVWAYARSTSDVVEPVIIPEEWYGDNVDSDPTLLQVPANTVEGDLMIVGASSNDDHSGWDLTGSGWTLLAFEVVGPSRGASYLYYRHATAGDTPGSPLGLPAWGGGGPVAFGVTTIPGASIWSIGSVVTGAAVNELSVAPGDVGSSRIALGVFVIGSIGFSTVQGQITVGTVIHENAGDADTRSAGRGLNVGYGDTITVEEATDCDMLGVPVVVEF